MNTLLHKDLLKPDRLAMNAVIQAGMAAAFVYQSPGQIGVHRIPRRWRE